jgi:tRNA (guanine37-N1)-methyltransferase
VKISVLTLFPGIVGAYFRTSIMAKAVKERKIEFSVIDIREYSIDKHRTCDDSPYGGGPGMVLKPGPIARAFDSVKMPGRVVYPTPSGVLFTQEKALDLASYGHIILICGRYEGIDQRIIDLYVQEEISLGDYVLSSGEIAALGIIDAVYRLVPGVIRSDSLQEESHTDGYLEYPQYTRPSNFRGLKVPEVLLSGNHRRIKEWRREKSLEKMAGNRPDMLERDCDKE